MLAVGWERVSIPPTWTRWVPCEELGLHHSLVAWVLSMSVLERSTEELIPHSLESHTASSPQVYIRRFSFGANYYSWLMFKERERERK